MNEQQFWSNMKHDPETGCLLWTRSIVKGYGTVNFNKKIRKTHRVAWTLKHGQIPDGYDVHHLPTCQKRCCNVDHLELIIHSEHMRLTHQLGQIINLATGERNGQYTHPERTARGDRHGSRTHPERVPRGENNGRYTHPEKIMRGEWHACAKISDSQADQIRELRKKGMKLEELRSIFGIGYSQISAIARGLKRNPNKGIK